MIVSRYRYQVVKTHLVEFDEELFCQKLTEILDRKSTRLNSSH